MKRRAFSYLFMCFALALSAAPGLLPVVSAYGLPPVDSTDPTGPELWSRSYGGTDQDRLFDMVTDEQGNVYATGMVYTAVDQTDIITLKVAPNGTTVWTRTYNGPGHEFYGDHDGGHAIALDTQGRVYITGWSNSATESDIIILRYTPAGALDLELRYDGGVQEPDRRGELGFAIAVDEQGICVAGLNASLAGTMQILTVRYTLEGAFEWARVVPGSSVTGILTDGAGNCYVVGTIYDQSSNTHLAIVKYSPEGDTIFHETFVSDVDHKNTAADMILDENGNLFITGAAIYTSGSISQNAALTVKYSPDGEYQWHDLYPGDDIGANGKALALGPDGNVWVAANVSFPDWGKAALLRYSNDGEVSDEFFHSGRNYGWGLNSITIDSSGNFYLAGRNEIAKLDCFGSVLWGYELPGQMFAAIIQTPHDRAPIVASTDPGKLTIVKYPAKPEATYSFSDVIVSESIGEAVVQFQIDSPLAYDVKLIVKTEDGSAVAGVDYTTVEKEFTITSPNNTLWNIEIPIPDNDIMNQGPRSFRLVVSGPLSAGLKDWSATITIIEDDLDLQRWYTAYTGLDLQNTTMLAYAVDDSGNSYTAIDQKMVSFSADGSLRWELLLSMSVFNLALTPQGDIVLVGDDAQANLAVQKVSAGGGVLWARSYDHDAGRIERGYEVLVNQRGEIFAAGQFVTGYTEDGSELHDILTLKFDPAGQLLWAQLYNNISGWSEYPVGIGADASDNIYVGVNNYVPGAGGSVTGLIKYSSQGQFLNAILYSFNGFSAPDNTPYAMQTVPSGHTYIALESEQLGIFVKFKPDLSLDFDFDLRLAPLGSGSIRTLAIDSDQNIYGCGGASCLKYNPDGTLLWQTADQTNGGYRDALIDSQGYLALAGTAYEGDVNIYTARRSPDGQVLWRQEYTHSNQVFTDDQGKKIGADKYGNIYVIGTTDNNFISIVSYAPMPDIPELTIGRSEVVESPSEAVLMFTVQLSRVMSEPVVIAYQTVDGSAYAWLDYIPVKGTAIIPAGSTSATISVPVAHDELDEFSEYFYLNLDVVSGAAVVKRSQATGVIWDEGIQRLHLPMVTR